MPLVATNGSGCTIEWSPAFRTELRNAPQAPPPAPRSPQSSGWPLLRCSKATAFLRVGAPGSAMARTPGVSLLVPLACSLRYAIRLDRLRARCVFSFPRPLPWQNSQAPRRTPVRSRWVGSASEPLRYWDARRHKGRSTRIAGGPQPAVSLLWDSILCARSALAPDGARPHTTALPSPLDGSP